VVEEFHPVETKAEDSLPFNPYYPTYPRYDSTAPMVTSYPSTNSHESSALMSQTLHSEPRMTSGTAVPFMSPGHNTAVALANPAPGTTVPIATPSQMNAIPPAANPNYNTAVPPAAATPGYNTAIPSAIPVPVEDFPPMYRDEDEAQLQSQRIRAEEAERARRYDALIANFCAENRDLISPALERKLHAARYLPEDNPSDVAADYWHTTYGVEFFELRRLQTAYERLVSIPSESM
jgi:hypothetical protein